LLEKLRPEMITLNPMVIGRVDSNAHDVSLFIILVIFLSQNNVKHYIQQEHKAILDANFKANHPDKTLPAKKKMRGKNRPSRRLRKKQQNVVDTEKEKYRLALEKKAKESQRAEQHQQWKEKMESAPTALNRFYKK